MKICWICKICKIICTQYAMNMQKKYAKKICKEICKNYAEYAEYANWYAENMLKIC